MATLVTATDDILSKFKVAWETPGADSDLGGGNYVSVYWPNTDKDAPTDVSIEWVKIHPLDLGKGSHSGIGSGTGRYTRVGFIIFQIFTEKGQGPYRANELAQIILDAYDGERTDNGVIFLDTEVVNVGVEEGGWFQTNITVQYEFDQFK